MHSSPLLIRGEVLGAFNLYADQPRAFDGGDTQSSIDQMAALTGFAITGRSATTGTSPSPGSCRRR